MFVDGGLEYMRLGGYPDRRKFIGNDNSLIKTDGLTVAAKRISSLKKKPSRKKK
jgi:hypothetical protein